MRKLDRGRTRPLETLDRPHPAPAEALDQRVRRDLERRGVSSSFSGAVAERLGSIAADLTATEYDAVLEGVAAAYGVQPVAGTGTGTEVEIQRLIQDFAVELQKLDEGLKTLSAYVLRIRERTASEPKRLLH